MRTTAAPGYEIAVDGHLDDHWSDRLGGVTIHRLEDGTSRIVVPRADQASLHGLLAGLRDLNVDLIWLRRDGTYGRDSHSERSIA